MAQQFFTKTASGHRVCVKFTSAYVGAYHYTVYFKDAEIDVKWEDGKQPVAPFAADYGLTEQEAISAVGDFVDFKYAEYLEWHAKTPRMAGVPIEPQDRKLTKANLLTV